MDCYTGEPADLNRAECHRSTMKDGRVWEVVKLNGSAEGISDEDLDRFVPKFPIEPVQTRALRICNTSVKRAGVGPN